MTSRAATTSPMVLTDRGGAVATGRSTRTSPLPYARLAGLLYLLITIASIFSFFYMRSRLIVHGDAAATATNILASEGLFRMAMASDAIVFLSEIVLAALLYRLYEFGLKNVHGDAIFKPGMTMREELPACIETFRPFLSRSQS